MDNGDIVNELSDLEYKGYYINPMIFYSVGNDTDKAIELMKQK